MSAEEEVRRVFRSAESVQPIRPGMSERAKRILDRIEFAGEIKPALDRPYVVKGWLDRGAVSVVYGEANVGKSFWAIDLAHHVHEGLPWAGCRVKGGPVLYIAAEGGALFDNRLVARRARFCMLRGPITLTGRNGEAAPLAEAVRELAEVHGPFALIVIDTLARVMGAADENAAADIAGLMKAADVLREQTGAHVMFIHHSGKDVARGARGHSSLRAAVDTEIELTKDDSGVRQARATKQRDLPGGAEQEFELDVVELGKDSDGDPVTSCVVKHKGGHGTQRRLTL